MSSYKHYTDNQIDYLRAIAKGRTRQEITDLFNERFNQKRTMRAIGSVLSRYKIRTGMQGHATRFNKGEPSWNAGKKMTDYLTDEQIKSVKKNQYKPGDVPQIYKPVGTERFTSENWMEIKIEEPDVWVKKHRHVWEQAHGEIPERHVILFKDENRQNCELDNLYMVHQSAVTTVGKRKSLTEYPELNELIYKVTELEVVSNVKERSL